MIVLACIVMIDCWLCFGIGWALWGNIGPTQNQKIVKNDPILIPNHTDHDYNEYYRMWTVWSGVGERRKG